MSTNFREEMRALVEAHHNSLLPTEDYRKRRAEILDRVAREGIGEPADDPNPDITAPRAVDDPSRTRPRPPASELPPAEPQEVEPAVVAPAAESGQKRTWMIVAGGVLVVAVAVLALMRGSGPDNASLPASPPAVTEPQTVAQLLEEFVRQGQWQSDDLDWLDDEWRALEPREHSAGKQSSQFRAFARELRERLALADAAGLVTENTRAQRDSLFAVAETMGIRVGSELPDEPPEQVSTQPQATLPVEESPPADRQAPSNAQDNRANSTKAPPARKKAAPAAAVASPVGVKSEPVGKDDAEKPDAVAGYDGCPRSQLNTRRKFCRDRFNEDEAGPKMSLIRAGTYRMGSTASANEQPAHEVTIREPFAVAVAETSFAEYRRFCSTQETQACPDNPWGDESLPVVNVSWSDAIAYTEWLSAQLGQTYRLLSESEWEFAARAGTTSKYPFGDEVLFTQARFSDATVHDAPVVAAGGTAKANAYGLVHTIGNVREWVQDSWQDTYDGVPADGAAHEVAGNSRRVTRGGSYADRANDVRSAVRVALAQDERNTKTGFRIGRTLRK